MSGYLVAKYLPEDGRRDGRTLWLIIGYITTLLVTNLLMTVTFVTYTLPLTFVTFTLMTYTQ